MINNNFDVFISYSSKNVQYVNQIKEALEDRGVKCWMANTYTISNGEDFRTRIVDSIVKCKIVLLILSKEAIDSTWVSLEITHALNLNKKIYSLKIDNEPLNELMSFKLGCSQMTDCTKNEIAVIESLAINIKKETDQKLEQNKDELVKKNTNFLVNYYDHVLLLIGLLAFIVFLIIFHPMILYLFGINIEFDFDKIKSQENLLVLLISVSIIYIPLFRVVCYRYISNVAKLNSPKALYIMYKYHISYLYFFLKKKNKALEYLKKSADLGYFPACFELSKLYAKGKKVKMDLELSKEYYLRGKQLKEESNSNYF